MDLLAAYAAENRRCRSANASAHNFVSRARIRRALDDDVGARADIETALQHDPADLEANLAAMRWGALENRAEAATRVIGGDGRDIRGLREAIRLKLDDGAAVVHRLRPSGDGASGWLAWSGRERFGLGLEDSEGEWTVEVAPDPSLALASEGYHIVEIEILDVLRLFDPLNGVELYRKKRSTIYVDQIAARPPGAQALSVIVPLYDGLEATKACLASLFSQKDIVFSTILVDDASPDARLSALADEAALRPGVSLLRNDNNLGFAGSINRALAITGRDNVLLLNADTVLPPRAIARLHAHVATDSTVGTATPFSNNSQLTSFPRPFSVNELPSVGRIDEIGEIAFAVNGATLVDVPSGIGFCLYITRACLDKTGPLPTWYGRGYYEDTEYCLMARERGFRNVCATGVFVGHAGSVSFKADKRLLVSRNVMILEDRFPRQGPEYLAFAQADPLRFARAAIEELLAPDVECTLIAASEARVHWQARERAKALRAGGEAAILLVCAPSGDRVELRRAEEGAPASLSFLLDAPGRRRLAAYLRAIKIRAVEMFDPARSPDPLIETLLDLGAPIDLFCVDPWVMRGASALRRGACETPLETRPCATCLANRNDAAPANAREARLVRVLAAARRVRSVDRMGAAFAQRNFGAKAEPLESEDFDHSGRTLPRASAEPHLLGVLAPVPSLESDRLLVTLSRKLAGRRAGIRMVVLGDCLNEDDITAAGSAIVVRGSDPDDFARQAQVFGVGRLALFDRTSLFGPLDRLARQIGVAKAYFDWSFGALRPSSTDLVMDPRVCDEKAAAAVAFWVNSD